MPNVTRKVALIMLAVSGGYRGSLSMWVLVNDVLEQCVRRRSVQVGVYRRRMDVILFWRRVSKPGYSTQSPRHRVTQKKVRRPFMATNRPIELHTEPQK